MTLHEFEHTVDERIAAQIAEAAQLAAAEMLVAVGIAPRTPQRTLARDFNGEGVECAPRSSRPQALKTLARFSGCRNADIVNYPYL